MLTRLAVLDGGSCECIVPARANVPAVPVCCCGADEQICRHYRYMMCQTTVGCSCSVPNYCGLLLLGLVLSTLVTEGACNSCRIVNRLVVIVAAFVLAL